MKTYIAMCSICMLVGAGLGHYNGQYSATAKFVDDCATHRVVAFKESDSSPQRHFHCFELDLTKAQPEKIEAPEAPVTVI